MLAMAAAVTSFPLLLVGVSFLIDEGTEDRMRARVRTSSADVAQLLSRDGSLDQATLNAVAEEHAVRLRVRSDHDAQVTMQDADRDGSRLAVVFFGDEGAPSLTEFDETLGPIAERAEALNAGAQGIVGCRTAPGGRLSVCHAARRLRVGDTQVLIYAQESSRRSIRALFDLRYQLLKLTLVVLPLSLLLAWWLGRRFVRPIEQLRAQVRAYERSGRSGPITLARGDELGELADAFDRLVQQLDARARSNEAFLADVAHELKSPVATVRACAETLEDRGADPARAARLGRALGASAQRMQSLLARLLELARAEAGMPDADRAPVALGALARRVVEDASIRHPGVQIQLTVDDEARTLIGVEDALAGALRNLIDNAASFGASVQAHIESEREHIALTVADDGPGIAPDDLPRVFDRFFTTRPRTEGTGLGLALVRAVIAAHGGDVQVSSPPGRGACFTVRLPA